MKRTKNKSTYRRSTPVIRLYRNVSKMVQIGTLVQSRLESWRSPDKPSSTVESGVRLVGDLLGLVRALGDSVKSLEAQGFVPPKKPKLVSYEVGQRVRIVDAYRPRYEAAHEKLLAKDPKLLDELVVHQNLPSGELAVRRTPRSYPIIVRKSHIARAREK